MGAWGFVVDAFGTVALSLLLMALGWAAFERGRIHHQLARRRIPSAQNAAAHPGGRRAERLLFGVFRLTRRGRRIHLAAGMVAGWM